MSTTPEGRVKKKLDAMLKAEGVWFFSPQAGPYGRAGIPDRIACANGTFIGIEAKADASKTPTKLQELCGEAIITSGGHWFLVYDNETIEQVRAFIRASCRREQGPDPKVEGS